MARGKNVVPRVLSRVGHQETPRWEAGMGLQREESGALGWIPIGRALSSDEGRAAGAVGVTRTRGQTVVCGYLRGCYQGIGA